MTRLSEVKWDNGGGLGDLGLWGVDACRVLAEEVVEGLEDISDPENNLFPLITKALAVAERLVEIGQKMHEFEVEAHAARLAAREVDHG